MTNLKKTPLIIRAPNWVGDVVMCLPALEALAQIGFELHIIGRPWILDLLAATSYRLYSISKNISLLKGSFELRKLPYKNMILFPISLSSAIMARLANKKIIAYPFDRRRMLLTKSAIIPKNVHYVEKYWELARFAASYWMPEVSWPNQIPKKIILPIPNNHLHDANKILHEKRINRPYWVLCPTSIGTGSHKESKVWPHWKSFSQFLEQRGEIIVTCPGPGEENACRKLLPNAILLPNINLGTYRAIMSQSKYIIANDSGPMHLASTLDTPMHVGIFGVTDPMRTRPWGGRFIGNQNGWPSLNEVLNACLQS